MYLKFELRNLHIPQIQNGETFNLKLVTNTGSTINEPPIGQQTPYQVIFAILTQCLGMITSLPLKFSKSPRELKTRQNLLSNTSKRSTKSSNAMKKKEKKVSIINIKNFSLGYATE